MRRKVETVVGMLLILILLQLAISTSTQATQISQQITNTQKIVVDQNGNGDYTSIQDAIDDAKEGSTIYVKAGKYCEIVEIKKQISLIGEDKDYTLINPISAKNKYAICLGAPGVMLKGFGITNGAPGLYSSGIRITSSGVNVYDCKIFDNPVGIVIWTSDNKIENCIFYGCKDEGIALIGSSYSECQNNQINNCKFYDNCDGIELQYASANTISNCEIYSNSHTGIDAIASSNNLNKISDCKIYDNEVNGIYLSSSSDNQIIDCSLYDNDDGDIIENKNSKNNQVISKNKKSLSNLKEALFSFINRFSNLKNGKFSDIFESLNF